MSSEISAAIITGICAIIAAMATIFGRVWGIKVGQSRAKIKNLEILDVLQIPVWVLNPQFKVIYLNSTAAAYYGRTMDQVQTWTVEDLIDQSGEYFENPDEAKVAKAHWRYHLRLAMTDSFHPMKTPPFLVKFTKEKVYMAAHAHQVKSGRLADHFIVFDQIIPQDQALCSGDNPTLQEAMRFNRQIEVIIKELKIE